MTRSRVTALWTGSDSNRLSQERTISMFGCTRSGMMDSYLNWSNVSFISYIPTQPGLEM